MWQKLARQGLQGSAQSILIAQKQPPDTNYTASNVWSTTDKKEDFILESFWSISKQGLQGSAQSILIAQNSESKGDPLQLTGESCSDMLLCCDTSQEMRNKEQGKSSIALRNGQIKDVKEQIFVPAIYFSSCTPSHCLFWTWCFTGHNTAAESFLMISLTACVVLCPKEEEGPARTLLLPARMDLHNSSQECASFSTWHCFTWRGWGGLPRETVHDMHLVQKMRFTGRGIIMDLQKSKLLCCFHRAFSLVTQ